MEKESKGRVLTFSLDEQMAQQRLDVVISQYLPDQSRSYVQKLFDMGYVRVNGDQCMIKRMKCNPKDNIEVIIPPPETLDIVAENIPLDIVYEDDELMVVNKPAGMVVHPAIGNYTGTLVNAIMYHCGDRLSSINGVVRPGIVHRIDKDTSGLLMIAKTDIAHESLSKQLAAHTITRKYIALVYSNFKQDEGTIDAPIGRDQKNRLKRAVTEENAKNAITHFRVIERFSQFTLLECQLETGRTHQIRVHMSYIKHPLVGDRLYGPKKQYMDLNGQLLHAKTIGFVHPKTGEYMEFDRPLPEDFQGVVENIRREYNHE